VSARVPAALYAEESPRALMQRVGRFKGLYDAIRLDFPPITDAVGQIDCIRIAALERAPGAPCGGGFLVAPTGTGKTETLKMVEGILNAGAEAGRRPALRVNFSPSGTTDSLPQSILAAIGARRPDAGSEKTQWQRAVEEMRRAKVEILLLDEFNRAARRPTMTAAIAISIQEWIMDPGVCPVVICGSERASTVLKAAPAVHERLEDQIDLEPLDWLRSADKTLMRDFLGDLDAAIVELGLLPALSGLDEGDLPKLLCTASAGKLRAIVKTVRVSLGLALMRRSPAMTRIDIAEGVDRYCLRQRLVGKNPFDAAGPSSGSAPRGTRKVVRRDVASEPQADADRTVEEDA
jgi:hypothetical protein